MKNTLVIIILIIIALGLFALGYFFLNNESNSTEYKVENITNNSLNSNNTNNTDQNILNELNNVSISNLDITKTIKDNTEKEIKEKEIASFSTNLKGDEARLNNIRITCNTINGTTIASGETFSFNKIIGSPSPDKGYMEADVFVNKKVEKGYGGGNCQVSTTIYNAALSIEGIKITERHPHKKKVSYIEEGKDAAVSYSGGLDLKFINNIDKTIKIYVSSDEDSVDVKIVEF